MLDAEDVVTGEILDIAVPSEWATQFKEGSVRLIDMDFNADIYAAELRGGDRLGKQLEVKFKIMNAGSLQSQREVQMVERLRTAFYFRPLAGDGMEADEIDPRSLGGHILSCFEYRRVGDSDFFLLEAEGIPPQLADLFDGEVIALSLQDPHTNEKRNTLTYGNDGLSMGLQVSLPILIDILRGVRDLEKAGIVHAALRPDTVLFVPGGRVAVSGLEGACLTHSADWSVSCESLADSEKEWYATSPIWQPPEVTDGAPTGFTNHAWSAGLLFSLMCFGYNPVERAVLRGAPLSTFNFDEEGRRAIRETITSGAFDIQREPGFKRLSPEAQELMRGMLEPNPNKRWTVAKILATAMKVAREVGVDEERLKPRLRPRFPPGWVLPEGVVPVPPSDTELGAPVVTASSADSVRRGARQNVKGGADAETATQTEQQEFPPLKVWLDLEDEDGIHDETWAFQ